MGSRCLDEHSNVPAGSRSMSPTARLALGAILGIATAVVFPSGCEGPCPGQSRPDDGAYILDERFCRSSMAFDCPQDERVVVERRGVVETFTRAGVEFRIEY